MDPLSDVLSLLKPRSYSAGGSMGVGGRRFRPPGLIGLKLLRVDWWVERVPRRLGVGIEQAMAKAEKGCPTFQNRDVGHPGVCGRLLWVRFGFVCGVLLLLGAG